MQVETDIIEREWLVGRIPIRNLWWLMLYASVSQFHHSRGKFDIEKNPPDDVQNLVAEILAYQVKRRLRRNLSYGYQKCERVLRRVRGRIDLLYTERHQLLDQGKIACRFEELTVNTPRTRLARCALEKMASIVSDRDLAKKCSILAASLKQLGVTGYKPGRAELSADQFSRNNSGDREMVFAAQLAFNLALPTESAGTKFLPAADREYLWVQRLFERGVAGFYNIVLSNGGWKVKPQSERHWPITIESEGLKSEESKKLIPVMRMDIILEHPNKSRRIVIDTKFSSVMTSSQYKKVILDSSHLYQIYAYLRTQERNNDLFSQHASGILLHPCIGEQFDEFVVIQNHKIRFATVDLTASSDQIRMQLLNIIEPHPDYSPTIQ